MNGPEDPRWAQHLADLRLQVSALESATKAASYIDVLHKTRRTFMLAALLLSAALITSAFIRNCQNSQIRALQHRLDDIERVTPRPHEARD